MRRVTELPKIKPRRPDSHKGDYGRILVIAGSTGMTGAAYLCSKAALRAGAGLVTLGMPASLNSIMAVKLTCAMTYPLPETESGTLARAARDKILELSRRFDVAVIGPGLSQHISTKELIVDILEGIDLPIVLDADGLNAIVGKLSLFKTLQNDLVITPHPGEMARLIGLKSALDIQNNRLKVSKDFINSIQEKGGKKAGQDIKKNDIVLVLKGKDTIVINRDKLYINPTGNPGMASGGSGDVLSGMIAALIGQGLSAFKAAQLGVYIHGLAGDIAAKEKGQISMIATDIIDHLPDAFNAYLNV